jgi:hypothetical protein
MTNATAKSTKNVNAVNATKENTVNFTPEQEAFIASMMQTVVAKAVADVKAELTPSTEVKQRTNHFKNAMNSVKKGTDYTIAKVAVGGDWVENEGLTYTADASAKGLLKTASMLDKYGKKLSAFVAARKSDELVSDEQALFLQWKENRLAELAAQRAAIGTK